ncbi:hypothetical protein BH18ACT1_BH18ACT1_09650 [soil metagenome]|nr:hypothetical protein [Acidimicrobiia bacterium]
MGIGVSVFLLAVGAILTFAVEKTVEGIDLDAVGIILMIAGLIGLAVTLLMMNRSAGVARTGYVEEEIVDDPARRRTYRRDL